MRDIELEGLWWLPSHEDNKQAGILTFSNEDGMRLKLIGSFGDHGGQAYPIILGVVPTKLVTLHNCFTAGSRSSMPGFTSQDFRATTAFIGAHFSSLDDIRLDAAKVRFRHMPEWVGTSGFKVEFDTPSGYQLTFKRPEEIKVDLDKASVSLTFEADLPGGVLDEAEIRQSVWFKIETERDLSFDDWYFDYIHPFRNFLTLATDVPETIEEVVVYSKTHTTVLENTTVYKLPVEVVFQVTKQEIRERRSLAPVEMLFTLDDIKDQFKDVLQRWLEAARDIDAVLNLFFGVQYNPRMYLEQQFLNVVQAAEIYHRRRVRTLVLPEEQHQERVKSILAAVPCTHKTWLEERLKYSNEPNLRTRMKELIDRTGGVISPLIRDNDLFVQKVVTTRNFLTHYDSRPETTVAEGKELFALTRILSILVKACLLAELGLPPERCKELIWKSFEFRNVRQYGV